MQSQKDTKIQGYKAPKIPTLTPLIYELENSSENRFLSQLTQKTGDYPFFYLSKTLRCTFQWDRTEGAGEILEPT